MRDYSNSVCNEAPLPNTTELPWDSNSIVVKNEYNKVFNNNNKEQDESKGKKLTLCDFETAILETGYGKYNLLLLLASIPGFFSCTITTGSISLILPSAECDLELDSFDMGLMNSISYIGMISCAFFWGFISDVYGRKKILVIAFTLDVILTITFALAQNFSLFIAIKLISGFINAAPYAILMSFLAECHASKYRARNLLWTGIFGSLGGLAVAGVAGLIIPLPIHIHLFDGSISIPSWRVFLLVSAIPSLMASILLSFFGESPKFLMSRGRNDEAMNVFKTMFAANTGKPRDSFPVVSLAREVKEDADNSDGSSAFQRGLSQIKPLFQKPYARHMVLLCVLQFLTLCGLNTVRLWLPELFSKMLDKEKTYDDDYVASTICELLTPEVANVTRISESIECVPHYVEPRVYINTMITSGTGSIGYLLSGFLVAKLGKRILLFFIYGIAGICSISMYWAGQSNIMVAITSVYVSILSIASTALISVVVDLIPTAQRSMAVCLQMMMGRIGAMVGNMSFALLLEWNCSVLFFLIAGIILGSGGLAFLLPVTKGAALK